VEVVETGIAERKSPPRSVGLRVMKVYLSDKAMVEPAPRPGILSAIRTNDDMVLLFRHDPDNEQYKYITGTAGNGKKFIGIMPFGEIKEHQDIAMAVSKRFDVELRDINGGWVMISDDFILIHGSSMRYPKTDHEGVEKAIRRLMPEMENFIIMAKPS